MQWKRLLISVTMVALFTACASKSEKTLPTIDTPVAPAPVAPVDSGLADKNTMTAVDPLTDPNSPLAKRSVYFDFDSNIIKEEYKSLVEAHAAFLKDNPGRKATIQGNTDPRGGREYNLALGQRRAQALKRALGVLGVSDQQLEAVSFGKEKPKASGDSEADYAENRRDDIVYDGE